jgi:hypothetical protein
MHIKHENNVMIMTESLVCKNYSDMKHYGPTFDNVGDNEYKCTYCNTIMVIREHFLVHDDKGRLRMRVSTESK